MRSLLVALLLSACGPRVDAAVQAGSPTVARVAAVMDDVAQGGVVAVPEDLSARIHEVVTAHNLQPQAVDATAAFAQKRTTVHRLEWLAEDAGAGEVLLLVQTEVRFYSQLSGRYRWTVDVEASVAPASDPAAAETWSFQVPVFLQFHHEREPEALVAAAPVVQRRLGALLDAWLSGAAE